MPNWYDPIVDAGGGIVDAFRKSDGSGDIDWTKILTVGGAAVGGIGSAEGWFDRDQPNVGYQGGIPRYDALQKRVPIDYNTGRMPGASGQRYFTDTAYVDPNNEEAVAAANTRLEGQKGFASAINAQNYQNMSPFLEQVSNLYTDDRAPVFEGGQGSQKKQLTHPGLSQRQKEALLFGDYSQLTQVEKEGLLFYNANLNKPQPGTPQVAGPTDNTGNTGGTTDTPVPTDNTGGTTDTGGTTNTGRRGTLVAGPGNTGGHQEEYPGLNFQQKEAYRNKDYSNLSQKDKEGLFFYGQDFSDEFDANPARSQAQKEALLFGNYSNLSQKEKEGLLFGYRRGGGIRSLRSRGRGGRGRRGGRQSSGQDFSPEGIEKLKQKAMATAGKYQNGLPPDIQESIRRAKANTAVVQNQSSAFGNKPISPEMQTLIDQIASEDAAKARTASMAYQPAYTTTTASDWSAPSPQPGQNPNTTYTPAQRQTYEPMSPEWIRQFQMDQAGFDGSNAVMTKSEAERRGYITGLAAGGGIGALGGTGDGMTDSIPAMIDGQQAAALTPGEFVVPADVVSHLGNGNSRAGEQQLMTMMSKIRKARTGNPQQGRKINPTNFLPK